MALYTFIHNLLDVLVHIADKMGVQKKISAEEALDLLRTSAPSSEAQR
jgi:hypothetical protein